MHSQTVQNSFTIPVRLGRGTYAEAHALRDAAVLWLRNNLDGRYGLYSDGEVSLERVADATHFMMAWGEEIAEVEAHNQDWLEGIRMRMRRVWARR